MYTREYVFNEKDDFVTAKIFKSGGRTYTGGEPFNREAVSTRRLRQMWETGFIKPVKAKEEVIEEITQPDNEPVPEVPPVIQGEDTAESSVAEDVIEDVVVEESEDAVFVGAVTSDNEIVEVEEAVEEKLVQVARRPGRPKKA